ncbi:1-phosphofructokinase family hexose kinase [Marinovum sp.]|uniref:1-phosphofructokinase family hexose kinase n=1 Tax=Marinovum sp. TaxID=2024839 RepID=UPI002B26BB67|nr:1-phosphofructokinase family hexose kinase [Marinovum sp.]
MQTNILTITLNPAVDFATSAPRVYPEHKLRCTDPSIDPGGGGINVARAVQMLGGHATALIAIGGATGAQLLQLLALEGVPTVAFQGPGETRTSFSVTDQSDNQQYRFVLPGDAWGEEDVARGLRSIDQAAADNTLVVLSGSQPPGVAKEFPSILAAHIKGRGAQIIVDTSGPALFQLAREPHETIFALRMDGPEAEELADRPLPTREDSAAFAQSLVERGVAKNIIVARGADGSVLSNAEGSWHAVGPKIEVVSKVGAGDSFVGAFALALARGEPVEDCLKVGVVAAGAACMTLGTRLCEKATVDRLLPDATLTRL